MEKPVSCCVFPKSAQRRNLCCTLVLFQIDASQTKDLTFKHKIFFFFSFLLPCCLYSCPPTSYLGMRRWPDTAFHKSFNEHVSQCHSLWSMPSPASPRKWCCLNKNTVVTMPSLKPIISCFFSSHLPAGWTSHSVSILWKLPWFSGAGVGQPLCVCVWCSSYQANILDRSGEYLITCYLVFIVKVKK